MDLPWLIFSYSSFLGSRIFSITLSIDSIVICPFETFMPRHPWIDSLGCTRQARNKYMAPLLGTLRCYNKLRI
jgi:hypothetical protein